MLFLNFRVQFDQKNYMVSSKGIGTLYLQLNFMKIDPVIFKTVHTRLFWRFTKKKKI